MVRHSRIFIFCCVVTALLAHGGLQSKPSKGRQYKARYSRTAHAKHKKKVRVPDPALAWADCGDNCITRLFNDDLSSVKITPVTGEIADFAVKGNYIYLLVRNFNLITDAIFTIRKDTGKIQAIWGIGRHDALALTCDGDSIWIASRSKKYFFRKLTMSGRRSGDVGLTIIPEGEMRGLAATPDYLAFSMRSGEESALYLFNRHTWAVTKMGSYHGMIGDLAYHQGMLAAYYNEFDTYGSHWLLLIDPQRGVVKKMRFIDTEPAAIASDGLHAFKMEKRGGQLRIGPFAVLVSRNLVVADPVVRQARITFPVCGQNANPFTADLWVPYPVNRTLQNVRRVSLEPREREITTDRFGNRWARVRWERATGCVSAVMKFDIMTAAAAFTIDRDYRFRGDDVPAEVRAASLGETSAFDVSNDIIKTSASQVAAANSYLEQLLALRNYVNDTIRFTIYDDRWARASEYLTRGRGDAFGQTVGFAALTRFLGFPARAAGGILLDDGSKQEGGRDTWNQAYLPGTGWIDIGVGRDYGHEREQFAGRHNRYFVTFEGDYDTRDYTRVFAEKEWSRVLRWSSADKKRIADVVTGTITVSARELKE
ncbi:MAG TPA: transglutaminase domain-containing protein [Spirochaetota bacterium]|nr:transglutaminase domain-containing protein [Spirochaetota bacterium]HOD14361.1 transglutaminase domain-containing protein [Spirochaetota bacterium]HPN12385.1 transglutaminase domain-containing protein [Spirochaetota bacterium]